MENTEPIELSRWRAEGGPIKVNHGALMKKLALRGKAAAALREHHVSYETLAKIKRGDPISARAFRRIVVALTAWPELEHAADLLQGDPLT